METKFEIGDVVHWPSCGEYTVTGLECTGFPEHIMLNGRYAVHQGGLTLVRRASAQREGGFAVGQRVRHRNYHLPGTIMRLISCGNQPGALVKYDDGEELEGWLCNMTLEPADPAQAQQECTCAPGCLGYACGRKPMPTQPAPMTRAARVLAGMMADPYIREPATALIPGTARRNEAARLRMVKMSLDRPLDAERARWERLVCAVHPVTSRAVRGRR